MVACAPVPNAWPGSMTISATGAAPGGETLGPSHGGRTCREGTAVAPAGAATSTGRWKALQRSDQSSGISVVRTSTSASPAAALTSGSAGTSPDGP